MGRIGREDRCLRARTQGVFRRPQKRVFFSTRPAWDEIPEALLAGASKNSLRQNPLVCRDRSEEHTSELQSHLNLVCRLLLEKKKNTALRLAISCIYYTPSKCSTHST